MFAFCHVEISHFADIFLRRDAVDVGWHVVQAHVHEFLWLDDVEAWSKW